jgi:hypothetical protein
MSGYGDGLHMHARDLENLPISDGMIHGAMTKLKIWGIDRESLGQIQTHLRIGAAFQQIFAHFGEIDAASGERSQLSCSTRMIEVVVCEEKCTNVPQMESFALNIARDQLGSVPPRLPHQ